MTEWRETPGFSDYEVSSDGHVRRAKASQPWRVGRPIKQFERRDGYQVVGLWRGGKQTTVFVHRLVCEAFHGRRPTILHEAAHCDGNPKNNVAANVAWKTHAENIADKKEHGTHLVGTAHPQAVLSEADIVHVFELRRSGHTLKEIASEFGIHFSTVSDIVNRNIWGHVPIPDHVTSTALAVDRRK